MATTNQGTDQTILPVYTHNNEHTLFVHIPKCGGSSITQGFRDAGYSVSFLNEPARTGSPDQKPCNPQHYHRPLVEQHILSNIKPAYAFTITRDPLQRLISEYTWRVPHMNTHINKCGYDSHFFQGFQYWAMIQFEMYHKNNYTGDNHIRPQTDFLMSDVEQFDINNTDTLACILGINIGRHNVSKSVQPPKTFSANIGFVKRFYELYLGDYEELGYAKPF